MLKLVLIMLLLVLDVLSVSAGSGSELLLAGFDEDPIVSMFNYNHERDELHVRLVDQGYRSGQAIEFTWKVSETQAAVGIRPTGENVWDGSLYELLTFWVQGDGSVFRYRVEITDASGERFEFVGQIDHKGWEQITVPFTAFQSRSWQPGDANVNQILDWPWRDVRFVALSGGGQILLDQFAFASTKQVREEPQISLLQTSQNGYRSKLYPSDWYPGFADAEGRFLHDFSYAGYRMGEAPIPREIPGTIVDVTKDPYRIDNTGTADVTRQLQRAISDVGLAGGGVVYLPAGVYRVKPLPYLNFALWISQSGVVVRGDGVDQTFIFNDETNMRSKNIIYAGPLQGVSSSAQGGWNQIGSEVPITQDLLEPTTQIPLADVSSFAVGDWIVVYSRVTSEFIASHDMAGWWDGMVGNIGPTFYRQIVAIDKAASTISIDIPTRYYLKTQDKASVFKATAPIREIGIEDLSIGNRENPKPGWGEEDYAIAGTGSYDAHNSYMVRFCNVVDSWALRVNSYRPAVNTKQLHLLSNGFHLYQSRNVSIVNTHVSYPQYRGGGGNGYLYRIDGNENLIQDAFAVGGRHNYSFSRMMSNGNVLHRVSSIAPSLVLDFHMHLSMANLLDGTLLDGDIIEARIRPYGGTQLHGATTSQSVFYNTTGIRPFRQRAEVIDSRQSGYGYVIGTQGAVHGVVTRPTVDHNRDTSPEDWVEAVALGAALEPLSLYEDQLARRLERRFTELLTIKVDGSPILPFLAGRSEYDVTVTAGAEIPQISARSLQQDVVITIVDAKSLPGTTKIHVTSADGMYTQVYQVHFWGKEGWD